MEGAVALVLALLAIPFVLPLISWVMARRVRRRVDDLEALIARQDERITRLTTHLEKLEKEGIAAAPPVVAPPRPIVPEPPPVMVTSPPKPIVPAPLPVVAPQAARIETPRLASPPIPPPPLRPAPSQPEPPPPEPPPPPAWSFDWEQLVGVRMFSAIAGIALVFAAVFFLRYSIDQGWLQPPVRVVTGIIVAITLLVVCDRKAARKYPVTANAMDAAAIAILFATFFAAHSLWNLISGPTAFALLALVTLVAVLLSIRRDSLFIAVLGLLGGFATPILLSTGENRPIPLFGYLLLLNVGLAWVAYRKGWTILSILTLMFTTLYQWGWVAKYLDAAQVPLAIGIFTIFPLIGYGVLMVARSRPSSHEKSRGESVEWTMLLASMLPVAFALYLAMQSEFRTHYVLIFAWLLLIDVGLLAVAIARSTELLHAVGALGTLLAVSLWLTVAHLPGSMLPMTGFVAAFVVLYLAAPKIAERFSAGFDDIGEYAILTAPLLLVAFPLFVMQDAQAASAVRTFVPLFALVALIVWRSFSESTGRLYFIAAFFALVTEAAWSSKYLVPETLPAALATYVAFAVLYLGVPHLARRRGTPLQPAAGPGIVLLFGLLLLLYFADARVATAGLWGLALLLAILNAALFIESASTSLPLLALAGSLVSWLVLLVWWTEAAAAVGLMSSLLVVVGLALVMVGGYMWGLKYATPKGSAVADGDARAGQGLWLALLGHLFLFSVAINVQWALPPWPLFGATAVIALAFSVAALAARQPAIHLASTAMVAIILIAWRSMTQPLGHASIGIHAFGVLMLFSLAWIRVMSRSAGLAAITAAIVIIFAEFNASAMVVLPLPAPFWLTLAAHVIGFVVLLALAVRFAWVNAASGFAVLAGGAAAAILLNDTHTGRDVLTQTGAIYAVFATYPFILGTRAKEDRDPYIAALIAGVWCFLIARHGMSDAGLEWMVGIVPVLIGAITALHLSQLLRIQPSGQRDLGRLALVAGAALAFLTVAIPLQLRNQWVTVGWALEGASVAWLYTRIRHRGLLFAAVGLLGAVFVRLALNPEVFRYEPRGDMRIVNWYLYTYVIATAAMFVAAWWLSKTDDEVASNLPKPRYVLPAGAGILLFVLLNIEIADFYSDGPEILFKFGSSLQQDLTYTIAWLIFGIIMLAAGIIARAKPARVASVILIAVTTFKCFLYDLRSLEGLYRVGAFVGLAISLALVSLALQKYVLAPEKETAS
ncbi:MAG: DUF2339 domain-containing protein [Cyanobacteria bacterium]|nr:DUF2339 domain-containing protein [Cyanobacteriota bacterium]